MSGEAKAAEVHTVRVWKDAESVDCSVVEFGPSLDWPQGFFVVEYRSGIRRYACKMPVCASVQRPRDAAKCAADVFGLMDADGTASAKGEAAEQEAKKKEGKRSLNLPVTKGIWTDGSENGGPSC